MSNKNIMNNMKNRYPFEKRGGWLAAYLICGVGAAVSLLTAMMGNERVHMIVTSLGLLGMVVINTILGLRKERKQYLLSPSFRRDAGIYIIWIFLLLVWYADMIRR